MFAHPSGCPRPPAGRPAVTWHHLRLHRDDPRGTFTETISFADAAAARVGEKIEMPPDMADDEGMMSDVEYIDLHHPWLASHR